MFGVPQPAPRGGQGGFFGGLAPGLEATALALLDPAQDAPLALYTVASGRADRTGLARYTGFARMVGGALRRLEHHGTPALLAIRGYGMGGRPRMHVELIELGALLRSQILRRRWPLAEVPVGTLTKFAAGRGDPSPAAVAAALAQVYRRSFGSSREAEAYGLAHVARALAYPEDYPPARVQALAQIARMRALQAAFEHEASKKAEWRAE